MRAFSAWLPILGEAGVCVVAVARDRAGVRFEVRTEGVAVVRHGHAKLGVLHPDRGVAELRVPGRENTCLSSAEAPDRPT